MGFGLLLIGYFITFILALNPYAGLFHLIGTLLSGRALSILFGFEDLFRYPRYLNACLFALSVYEIGDILREALYLDLPFYSDSITYAVDIFRYLLIILYHLTLLLALKKQARSVELPSLENGTYLRFTVLGFFTVSLFIVWLPLSFSSEFRAIEIIFELLLYITTAFLIWRSYMWICPAGDEEMPVQMTGIGWLDRLRVKRAEREESAARSTKAYAEEKLRRRKEKREREDAARRNKKGK